MLLKPPSFLKALPKFDFTSLDRFKGTIKAFILIITFFAINTLVFGCNNADRDTVKANRSIAASPHPAISEGLKIGALLPMTGDLSAGGQPIVDVVPLLVETVNQCGGVNNKPVTFVAADDQSVPDQGAEAMTKLAEVDKVGGVVGSLSSAVSSAAVNVAVRNKVVLISPGSTSPVFTERAKKGDFQGFWARTAPPDTYQAKALAKLAKDKGFKRVATIVINNDYGVGFEQEFAKSFKSMGGVITNEANHTRYDPKAVTFETEVAIAFSGKPDAVVAVLYPDSGSLLLKTAYEQGLSKGVQILLTDGVYAADFPGQVGRTMDGESVIAGALGTTVGADGLALETLSQVWKVKKGKLLAAATPHTWDAAAILILAAQAAKSNTGEGIRSKIREVTNPPGIEVSDVCQGLELLRQGRKINYQGASGNVDIDKYGDVVGNYEIWTVNPNGELAVIGKINLNSN